MSQRIRVIRGQRVLLDSDLAALNGVTTKRLNEQVRRNADRFPQDFIFQLTNQEVAASRSQIATLNGRRGSNIKHLPLAFTEHGVVMAANLLSSPQAVAMSVYIVRAFVRLRTLLEGNAPLARKLDAREKSVAVQIVCSLRRYTASINLIDTIRLSPVRPRA